MKPGARLKAAAEVLDDVLNRHRPASTALADWGKAHRFAGSGDRSAIGSLVFDALRRRQSITARMGSDSPRALAIGAAATAFSMSPDDIAAAADGTLHTLDPLSPDEQAALVRPLPPETAPYIAGDFPAWLAPSLERVFGSRAAEQGAAMSRRAPIDLRVNSLKTTRDKVLAALQPYGAIATPMSPLGVRIPAPEGTSKAPHIEAEVAHGKGWFEVQDEGSQIAALIAGADHRAQVLDLCAGAGGKTLALAASMLNSGQVYAYDDDKLQLRPIFERLQRAGARNVQVLNGGNTGQLLALGPRFDLVLADAPCTGSGTWRRRPDAKWRLKPQALAERQADQRTVLSLAARLVKPGGRLVYVTCSVLAEENTDQVTAFLAEHPDFSIRPYAEAWHERLPNVPVPSSADGRTDTLLLTPLDHGTDGFFIASFVRAR